MNPANPEADLRQPGSEQRRSLRLPVAVVLLVKWKQDNVIFSEDAQALQANLYGATLRMEDAAARRHPSTADQSLVEPNGRGAGRGGASSQARSGGRGAALAE